MNKSRNALRQQAHRDRMKDAGYEFVALRLRKQQLASFESLLSDYASRGEKKTKRELIEEALDIGMEGPDNWAERSGFRYVTIPIENDLLDDIKSMVEIRRDQDQASSIQALIAEAIDAGLGGPSHWLETFANDVSDELRRIPELAGCVEAVARCIAKTSQRTRNYFSPTRLSHESLEHLREEARRRRLAQSKRRRGRRQLKGADSTPLPQ